MNPSVTYLITTHNEGKSIQLLLDSVVKSLCPSDEIIILDDYSDEPITRDILSNLTNNKTRVIYDKLDDGSGPDYGRHKNVGVKEANGNFIFQLDSDELPPDALLGENLHELILSNPNIEAFALPRINHFDGVTEKHAKQWGWQLTHSKKYNAPIINHPDYQFRIFLKDYPRISFNRRLHEKIEGYKDYSLLPFDTDDYALYHYKLIETQVATNLRYNKVFTAEENRGHRLQ